MPSQGDEVLEEEDEGLEGSEQDEEVPGGPASEKNTLLDVTVVPFELITGSAGEKLSKLRKAIQEKIQPGNLTLLKEERYSRLVTLTVVFYIWKGSGKASGRSAKELSGLMRPVLDVLQTGDQGLGVIEKDSYVCEVYATKELVETEKEEGYRIIMEEFENEEMLGVLNAFYGKNT